MDADVLDIENITDALKTGPYGRCVYECGNDIVDHQVVNIEYEEGVTASMTMSACKPSDLSCECHSLTGSHRVRVRQTDRDSGHEGRAHRRHEELCEPPSLTSFSP